MQEEQQDIRGCLNRFDGKKFTIPGKKHFTREKVTFKCSLNNDYCPQMKKKKVFLALSKTTSSNITGNELTLFKSGRES